MSQNSILIRQWRREYARRLLQLDFLPTPDTAFNCSTESIVEGMRLVRTSFSSGFTVRDDELTRESDDSFAVVISRSKQIVVQKTSHNSVLGQGDAALLRISEPGVLGAKQQFAYVGMIIPAAELISRLPDAVAASRQRVRKSAEGLQLLRAYVRGLENGKRVLSINSRTTVQRHLFDLVALSFETKCRLGESSLSAVTEARLTAAREIIQSDFNNYELSITAVADKLKISSRYLQRLFS